MKGKERYREVEEALSVYLLWVFYQSDRKKLSRDDLIMIYVIFWHFLDTLVMSGFLIAFLIKKHDDPERFPNHERFLTARCIFFY